MKKVALITGSAKRIGREISLCLASKGFDLALHYNTSQKDVLNLADEICDKFKVKCDIFHSDLSSIESSKKLITDVIKKFPSLSLLINNASIFRKSNFLQKDFQKEFLENTNIHLVSPLILSNIFSQNILKNKINDGHIINILDKNIVRHDTSYFYYLFSKKQLAILTKMLSLQLAPNIRVNGIAPGFILDSEESLKNRDEFIKKIPLQKKGEIKNIIQTINFFLENNFINGEIIFVDGAASLNNSG